MLNIQEHSVLFLQRINYCLLHVTAQVKNANNGKLLTTLVSVGSFQNFEQSKLYLQEILCTKKLLFSLQERVF